MKVLRVFLGAAALLAAAGCKPDVACDLVFGDPGQPIELTVGQFKDEERFEPTADGDTLDLRQPPQGGKVAYVGVRVTNVAVCDVRLHAEVVDPDTGYLFGQHEPPNLVLTPVPGQPDVGETEPTMISRFANIPLCPNYESAALLGRVALLRVTFTERLPGPGGDPVERTAQAEVRVVPTCNERNTPDADANRARCECECAPNFCLGRCGDPPRVCPEEEG